MNSLFAKAALRNKESFDDLESLAAQLSMPSNDNLRTQVRKYALKHGMYELDDHSGTNISVQVFDTAQFTPAKLPKEIQYTPVDTPNQAPVLLLMDYAFGEQAFESMDELLKPFELEGPKMPMPVQSISIIGKAGTLLGKKGDIMIPHAHVFEGSADNYPFVNDLKANFFKMGDLDVFEGTMITVLGTSLQNKDILQYFQKSSWRAIGLEMEGAHYQKAIQAATTIRKNISPNIPLRYAYYASDNPLETGSTLASGSLGLDGVKPTYRITVEVLNRIFKS